MSNLLCQHFAHCYKVLNNLRQCLRRTTKNCIEIRWHRATKKLRTMARQHIDQTIRRRNFKAWNERTGTGILVNCHKGRNVSAERKVGDCYQWKANGQCSKGDSCSLNHGSRSGQGAPSSSSTSKAPTQTDGRTPYTFCRPRGASPSGLKARKQWDPDASMVTSVISDTLRLVGAAQ